MGFATGFFILAVVSCFVGISAQALTAFSLSSALFAMAQMLENNLIAEDEEQKKMLDAINYANNVGLSDALMLFLKKYYRQLIAPEKRVSNKIENMCKMFTRQNLAKAIECFAVVTLVVGLAVPMNFFEIEWVSRVSTIVPFGFLFLSIWQVEKSRSKIQMWEEIQLFAILFQKNQPNDTQNIQIMEDVSNGQP